jgi:hypothetical protein
MSPEYLAGFFDGEGTFHLGQQIKNGKNYPHHTVMLSQSGEDGLKLLEEIQTQYGGKIYQHLRAGEHKATKPAYKLYWRKQEASQLIPQLLPFLRLKKTAAEQVLMYVTRN